MGQRPLGGHGLRRRAWEAQGTHIPHAHSCGHGVHRSRRVAVEVQLGIRLLFCGHNHNALR